jgi:hypothetical protein
MPNINLLNKEESGQKPNRRKQKKAMQNMLERLKEIELAFYLCPKLTETQTDLLVRKFETIVKDAGFPDYTKNIVKRKGSYYLVDGVI